MMKRTLNKREQRKKKRTVLITSLLVVGAFITSIAIWLGVNDWDVDKSLQRIGMAPILSNNPSNDMTDGEDASGETSNDTESMEQSDVTEPLPETPQKPVQPTEKAPTIDAGGYIEGQELPNSPTYIKGILIANKKYPLPSDFAPGESVEARTAFEEMVTEAKKSGISLTAFSTYRSFDYQTTLYNRYVARDGKEAADRYSARPGYSEHQTGLAFDIGEVGQETHWASASFGDTAAGKWVGENAHRFGFILRYPLGKEDKTGYMHESWHFRYVGIELATDIYQRNITLEEYLGIE